MFRPIVSSLPTVPFLSKGSVTSVVTLRISKATAKTFSVSSSYTVFSRFAPSIRCFINLTLGVVSRSIRKTAASIWNHTPSQ